MTIIDRLAGDHQVFREMLRELDRIADQPAPARDQPGLWRTTRRLKDLLSAHSWVEDTFYYPVIRESLQKGAACAPLTLRYMDHLDHEHRTIERYLDQLEAAVQAPSPARTWPQTYALFAKGLASHMKREEEELFPLSERLLGAQRLEVLSQELDLRWREAPAVRFRSAGSRGVPGQRL